MLLPTVLLILVTIQTVTYVLTLRAANRISLGPNARRFIKLIGINMLINCVTVLAFSVLFVSSLVAAIAAWNVGTHTIFPEDCSEWKILMASNINWPPFRNAFVAFVMAMPLQFVRAALDPLVHIIGSSAIRKSLSFGLL